MVSKFRTIRPRRNGDVERHKTLLLSNRQYAALRLFTDERSNFCMDTDDALSVDQRSFGSLFHRGYIRYDDRKAGFVLTNLGQQARLVFDGTDVHRMGPATTFSFYLRSIKALRRIA